MVTLEPMPEAACVVWMLRTWVSWREELLRAGMSEIAAEENVAQTVPNGSVPSGQHVFQTRKAGKAASDARAAWPREPPKHEVPSQGGDFRWRAREDSNL